MKTEGFSVQEEVTAHTISCFPPTFPRHVVFARQTSITSIELDLSLRSFLRMGLDTIHISLSVTSIPSFKRQICIGIHD
jgi:hypothetical protein